ncbi:hypothetical protein BJY21_002044 [Kineosphaera limosa]|nr:nucleotidyltransferase domain-containing protein [Kineosphaera limosa]NYE00860.1 hypothetical protein [Kineosphaera limosa]
MMPSSPAATSVGDRITATENEILRVEVGSTAHGISVGNDDLDLMAVYVETPEQLLGIAEHAEHYVSRTQPEGARSGPGDVDYVAYSLRKFLRLATVGNPTVLVLLYGSTVHATSPLGEELRALAPAIVSRRAGYRFLGYLDGQLERMRGGGRQSRVPSRPELVEQHGYDTKYAAHALRLGLQGIELIDTGHLTLPLPEAERDLCRAMRSGTYSREEADRLVTSVRADLAEAVDDPTRGPLRDGPDLDTVNAFAIRAHQEHWAKG